MIIQTSFYFFYFFPSLSDICMYIILNLTAKQQAILVDWLNGILPELRLPVNVSDDELREIFIDGSVLCQILNRLKHGSVSEVSKFGFLED